jgi:hypothetical protein
MRWRQNTKQKIAARNDAISIRPRKITLSDYAQLLAENRSHQLSIYRFDAPTFERLDMTDNEITKIADQCGMYECHDNGRIDGDTVLNFAYAILAAQLAAPVAQEPAQEPRKLTMSMFATVADLEAARAAQKAQPAPAQGEPDDAKDAARYRWVREQSNHKAAAMIDFKHGKLLDAAIDVEMNRR